jgi:hypothetical protein
VLRMCTKRKRVARKSEDGRMCIKATGGSDAATEVAGGSEAVDRATLALELWNTSDWTQQIRKGRPA